MHTYMCGHMCMYTHTRAHDVHRGVKRKFSSFFLFCSSMRVEGSYRPGRVHDDATTRHAPPRVSRAIRVVSSRLGPFELSNADGAWPPTLRTNRACPVVYACVRCECGNDVCENICVRMRSEFGAYHRIYIERKIYIPFSVMNGEEHRRSYSIPVLKTAANRFGMPCAVYFGT